MNIPYTYLIGWAKHQKFYYGVRYAAQCNPSDLWVTYFTSSKHVKEFRKKYGDPDIIKIRKTFDSKNAAILWESKVLTRLKVVYNDNWINRTNNRAIEYTKTKEQLAQFSKKMKGRTSPFKGKTHTDAAKEQNRISHIGKKTGRTKDSFTSEWKANISKSKSGVPSNQEWTIEQRKAASKKALMQNFGAASKGRIWINDGSVSIRIYPEQFENYTGYKRGRL